MADKLAGAEVLDGLRRGGRGKGAQIARSRQNSLKGLSLKTEIAERLGALRNALSPVARD